MKNIHILPTDKPSRLVKLKMFGKDRLHLFKGILSIQDEEQYQNIYITSDEEIKKGDWFYDSDGELCKYTSDYTVDPNTWEDNKKIILTDNKDLINDGVQAIDYTFLEWFVKNPSCEFVEIEDWYNKFLSCCKSKEECYCNKKRIILPSELKQETIEEAALRNCEIITHPYYLIEKKLMFIEGAKWQQEQDKNKYSEEDLREAFRQGQDNMDYSDIYGLDSKLTEQEWFKQFKKK